MSGNNIKVVVRCRPLNAREKARGAQCLIRMEGNKTVISKPASPGSKVLEDPKAFTFDQSYWSADKNDTDYADQERVYNDLGREVLDHAFNGYNCCIFAYGQTGSGKSYSMVGYGEEKGIIPRTCSELFDRVDEKRSDTLDFQVEVSYIEIYNEKVRDLLNPKNTGNLKVREHPVLGPYVQDLSRLAVNSYQNLDQLMDEGNKARTVAATNMNETSSRSHAVFTIFVTQKLMDPVTKQVTEKVARISLVDLAGSERANSTGATGVRLKEGANINKSLTTLGKVIAGLAEQASNGDKKSSKKKEAFIPFRDSVLTWLLKDSLGGNSKTCMIAAISPADYDETLSTLRYADQAKKIKTKAVVNEDPNAKMMRELKDEVEALRQALMVYAPEQVEQITANAHPVKGTAAAAAKPATKPNLVAPPTPSNTKSTIVFTDASGNMTQLTKEEVVEQLQMSEKLLSDLNQTWEEKLQQTEQVHIEREKSLVELGITIEKTKVGLYTPKETPYLINLNEDPLMSECLMYNIKPGLTFVDVDTDLKERQDGSNSIRLSGSNINKEHCYFENKDNVVTLYPRLGCTTMVNGMRVSEPRRLHSGYRIIIGDHHVFRFNNPGEAMKEREQLNDVQRSDSPLTPPSPTTSDGETNTPPTPAGTEIMDWNFARREAMLNTYINDSSFDNFTNEDLDKLFDDVARIRIIRKRQSSGSDTLSHRTSSSSFARRSFYSTTPSSSSYMDETFSVTDTSSVSSSSTCSFILNAKDEQQLQTEHSRRRSEAKLRRLSSQELSPREKYLMEKTVNHWKKQRNIAMAKTILTYDKYLAQANALAAKADKDVFYQFAVVHDSLSAMAVSHWDTTSSFSQQSRNTMDPDLIKSPKPCIAVQVIDNRHQTLYVWSIEKFMARLRYLQGAYYASDPRKYMKGDDLFYESTTTPSYILVGLAKVPLRNLMTQVPVESALTIHCRNTGRVMGSLKVLISPIARSIRYQYRGDKQFIVKEEGDPKKLLHVGQQFVFEISILEASGLSPEEFSQVHAQFRLSTFGDHLDSVFVTNPVDISTKDAVIEFNFHQTLSMAITEELLDIIETNDIVFEVYGKPTVQHLDSRISKLQSTTASSTVPVLPTKQSDDVIARIQICEITPDGDYKPVPVESAQTDVLGQYDTFSLQQGQQRRIMLSLESSASFDSIKSMRIGQVRLIDSKHRTIDSDDTADIPLHIVSAAKTSIYASWDSSLHNTILLNAITASQQKVALMLTWTVIQKLLLNGHEEECELQFEKEIYVHIKDQNRAANLKKRPSPQTKRTSSLMNFFAIKPSNIKSQATALFSIEYRPELVGGIQDLPLMELPARILRNYHESRLQREMREQVDHAAYCVHLATKKDLVVPSEKRWDAQAVIHLWQQKRVVPEDVRMNTKPASVHRWVPQVQQIVIPMNEELVHLKKGFLLLKNEANDWDKFWCVLTGHHLFLYPDQFEINEVDILNIRSVNKTMNSKTLFTVNTLYDSHTFQAPNANTTLEWLSMFD